MRDVGEGGKEGDRWEGGRWEVGGRGGRLEDRGRWEREGARLGEEVGC